MSRSNQNLQRDKPKLLESFACCRGKKLSMNISEVTFVRKISVLLQRDRCAAPDRGGTRRSRIPGTLAAALPALTCPDLRISVCKNCRLAAFPRSHCTAEKFESKQTKEHLQLFFFFLTTVTLLQVCFGSAWRGCSSFVLQIARICEC